MLKLNLGCGVHAMQGWVCYDVSPSPGVTVLDLSKGHLPHGDSSVDFIFSEHFIEHITRDQALRLLKDCYRVLKPTGVLRLSTPDLAHLIHCYQENQLKTIPGVWEPETTCDMVNQGMRLWGHQYLYDKPEMIRILQQSGFKSAFDCQKGVSMFPELRNLEVRPQYFEMYIEARKSAITL